MTATRMFLVGRHITHSLSPAMWNHLLETTGRPVRYGLRDVEEDHLGEVEREIRSGDVLAANVTMPHKAWAAAVADERSPEVSSTGAANLLLPADGRMQAHNTDVAGARLVLGRLAPFDRVLVVGAGGTAAAMLEALAGLAVSVLLTNRSAGRADMLAERFARRFERVSVLEWEERESELPTVDLVVNTTPLVDHAPLDLSRCRSDVALYDVIYGAEPTALQLAAVMRGIALSDGLAHLAAQAVAMLGPLGFEQASDSLLVEGLERAVDRPVLAWGEHLV